MEKFDLADVCTWMKKLIIPDVPDDFGIAEKFRHCLTDGDIRKGITAFRAFLYGFFDMLAVNKDILDLKTRDHFNPYDKRDRANARVCFPTIFDLTMILFSLGVWGRLEMRDKKLTVRTQDLLTVICEKTEKYLSLIKMSGERKLEMFRILSDLGLRFHGADFSETVDFSQIESFDITFAHDEFFIVGLKLLAEATLNHKEYYYIMNVFTVLLQCDFYPLANATPQKHVQHIDVFADTQAPEISEWIKSMDELMIKGGCSMLRSDGNFQYKKRGESVTHGMVCIIGIDITGCFITPGVNHLVNPNSIIDMLPDEMANVMKRSGAHTIFDPEWCYRKSGNMGFSPYAFSHNGESYEGCRHAGLRCQFSGERCRFDGYRFDLADPRVRKWTRKWIEMELAV